MYEFPSGLTPAEVRAVIAAHNATLDTPAFVEVERDDCLHFNYLFQAPEVFPPVTDRASAILRECRGLTFTREGRLTARKYAKFFGVGQLPETQIEQIDWRQPHVILDKLDGSMITLHRRDDGTALCHSKMGATPVAKPVDAFVAASGIPYHAFADSLRAGGKTALFEWMSNQQRIVLDHPLDRLELTGIRDNHDGRLMPYAAMVELAAANGIPVVGAGAGSLGNVKQFLADVAALEDAEGVVVRFDSGLMLKVKSGWYSLRHNAIVRLAQEKYVWALILSGAEMASSLRYLPPASAQALTRFAAALHQQIGLFAGQLHDRVEQAHHDCNGDRRRFAVEHVNIAAVPAAWRPLMFLLWGGADPQATVRGHLLAHTSSLPRLASVRALVGNLCVADFYPALLTDS